VDVKQVGRELGVRYVLEGSVRRAGGRLRITGQLIETETGVHIWAQRYDGAVEDVFDLQDHVSEAVTAAIEPQLRQAEIGRARRKRPKDLNAYDRYLWALANFYRNDRSTNDATLEHLRETMRLAPDYAPPYALAAQILVFRHGQGWSADFRQDRAEGTRLARAAVARERDDPTVLALAGHALAYHAEDYDNAIALLERSLVLNPTSGLGQSYGAWVYLYAGLPERAVPHLEAAMRLSPLDDQMFVFQSGLAIALVMLGRDEEAVEWSRRAIRENAIWAGSYLALASALAHLGRMEEARAAVHGLRQVSEIDAARYRARAFRGAAGKDRYLAGLRLAAGGVPLRRGDQDAVSPERGRWT
jgi:adenylate cyclase